MPMSRQLSAPQLVKFSSVKVQFHKTFAENPTLKFEDQKTDVQQQEVKRCVKLMQTRMQPLS